METILAYNNNSGSVNLYMAHGGTNFGWSIGGQEDCAKDSDGSTCLDTVAWNEGDLEPYKNYVSVITSYDYDAPISEAGDYGQPGTGPPPDAPPANKYEAIRSLIRNHTGQTLPPVPPRPRILAYGEVVLSQQDTLLSQLDTLAGPGIYSETPKPMEEYNQWNGMILYRTNVSASDLRAGATLYVGSRVRDSAVILAAGTYVGSLERNGKLFVVLNDAADKVSRANADQDVVLDILVMQIGRSNFGRNFDLKGLVSDVVLLNGKPLKGWLVFPLPLDSLDSLQLPDVSTSAAAAASAAQGSPVHVEVSIAHAPHLAPTRPPGTPLAQAPKSAVTSKTANTAHHTQVANGSKAPAHAPSPADHAKQLGPPAHAPGPARAEVAAHAPALAPTHRAEPPAPGVGPLATHTGVANHTSAANHTGTANHTALANHTGAANHIGAANHTGSASHTGVNPKLEKGASPLLRSHSTAAARVSLAALDTSHDTSRAELMKEMEEVARSEAFPAISAFVASNGGQACRAAPKGNGVPSAVPSPAFVGPTFYRGYFSINASLANADGVFPDTYLNIGLSNWAKGVAFINGFNLGYYWPAIGPANTMYIPGPLLRACNNELVLLEVGNSMIADRAPTVVLTDQPDFHGPRTNGTSHAATSFQAWTAGRSVDPSYYWRTGVEGGHLIPTSNQG
ncbi:g5717 [Coccomyxa elongata]